MEMDKVKKLTTVQLQNIVQRARETSGSKPMGWTNGERKAKRELAERDGLPR